MGRHRDKRSVNACKAWANNKSRHYIATNAAFTKAEKEVNELMTIETLATLPPHINTRPDVAHTRVVRGARQYASKKVIGAEMAVSTQVHKETRQVAVAPSAVKYGRTVKQEVETVAVPVHTGYTNRLSKKEKQHEQYEFLKQQKQDWADAKEMLAAALALNKAKGLA